MPDPIPDYARIQAEKTRRINRAGAVGAVIGGAAVLGLGVWIGYAIGGRRHRTAGALTGAAVAAIPAYAAAMMAGMVVGGFAGDTSPV